MYFDKCPDSVPRVFIETDDCLARKKDASIDLARGGNVFDYFRTFARIRKYEAATATPTPAPTPSLSSVRQIDASWIYSGWACSIVSWNNALQTDLCPDSSRFVNHRSHFPPSLPSRRDAAAKFSSDKISGAIVPRNVVGGVAFPRKWISVESLICWERFNGILPGFGRESAKYRDVPKDVLHWQEVRRHLVRSPFLAETLNLNLSIRIFQDTIRFWERLFKWFCNSPGFFERIYNFSLFQERLIFLSYLRISFFKMQLVKINYIKVLHFLHFFFSLFLHLSSFYY